MISIAQESLGLRRTGISPVLSLLMSAFSLVRAPQSVALLLQCPNNALLPRLVETRHPELRYTAYRQLFSAQDLSMSQLLRIV